jgi:DNA-binding MarR family transcriptional regulator
MEIIKCLCEHGSQSVRRLADQTGLSKSSVHRLTQAMERRNSYPESWFWETEDGRGCIGKKQTPPDFVVKLQRLDIVDVIFRLVLRPHVVNQREIKG